MAKGYTDIWTSRRLRTWVHCILSHRIVTRQKLRKEICSLTKPSLVYSKGKIEYKQSSLVSHCLELTFASATFGPESSKSDLCRFTWIWLREATIAWRSLKWPHIAFMAYRCDIYAVTIRRYAGTRLRARVNSVIVHRTHGSYVERFVVYEAKFGFKLSLREA